MNVQQALETLPGLAATVYDHTPDPQPSGLYAVVSELIEGTTRRFFSGPTGAPHSLKEMTVLITVWGAEGGDKADLRPTWLAAKALQGKITEHPGIPRLIGIRPGPAMPPTFDRDEQRVMAGVRFILNYPE